LAHAAEIRSLLARRNAVDIRVFGSVARGDDSPGSDVDFLVEFGPEASILDQVHLELDLMALLDCEVDVVPLGGLKKRDTHVLAEAVAATRGDDLRRLDIVEACEGLERIVQSEGELNDEILLRAAERLLEIIGEAATNCSEDFRVKYPAIDRVGITRLRVVLAHHYHRTQPELICRFASVDAPFLHARLCE
jgi:predicted nucleotidyltransferase/uncharacterized protein with HEPN domain